MEMMQQWEPLLVVYIKDQMEVMDQSEKVVEVCGMKGDADKQFVYFLYYHRRTDGKHRQCRCHKAVTL